MGFPRPPHPLIAGSESSTLDKYSNVYSFPRAAGTSSHTSGDWTEQARSSESRCGQEALPLEALGKDPISSRSRWLSASFAGGCILSSHYLLSVLSSGDTSRCECQVPETLAVWQSHWTALDSLRLRRAPKGF